MDEMAVLSMSSVVAEGILRACLHVCLCARLRFTQAHTIGVSCVMLPFCTSSCGACPVALFPRPPPPPNLLYV